ncbi:hypothetical protein BGW39_004958 [Mortierella sp. 14UC]|nr:hypothetical protein BGW39_004958 [Mortierella sp. 14UC]
MYAQELSLKEAQIHPGMVALERFESLQELQRSWGLQRRIDFGLEQEIVERIKAYKRVLPAPHINTLETRISSIEPQPAKLLRRLQLPRRCSQAVLQSSPEAKQFYANLIDSEPTFLRELGVTLDLSTIYNDLKHMRDAVLKVPQILKLRLDCGNHSWPTTDIVNRGKRGNPPVQIMMQHRHLVLIDFGSDGLFSKSTNSAFEDTPGVKGDGAMSVSAPSSRRGSLVSEMSISSSTPTGLSMVSSALSALTMGALRGPSTHEAPTTHLREVHIDGNFDPKAHVGKLKALLERSPKLFALTLTCKDLDFVGTVYTIHEPVSTYPMFRYLDLSLSQFSAVFDQLDPTSAFAKTPMRGDFKPNLGLDNSLVVIERFGSDLETLLIDDSFSNEHIQLLKRVTSERRKLKLLDMRIGFAMISNSAITEAGQRSLEVILRRPPQSSGPPGGSGGVGLGGGGAPLGGSTEKQLRRKSMAQQQLSNLIASSTPGAILMTDQINLADPPPQTYPIRSIDFRGTGGVLQEPAIRSLTRLLSLAPHLELLSMADFDIESIAEWEAMLGSIALRALKQISLHETNVDGHQLALFMNRVPVGLR